MSNSREKRPGGRSEHSSQNSSRTSAAKGNTEKKNTKEYAGRLRPRPTRQTERYTTPVKRKKNALNCISPSKELDSDNQPSTSASSSKRRYPEEKTSVPKAKVVRTDNSAVEIENVAVSEEFSDITRKIKSESSKTKKSSKASSPKKLFPPSKKRTNNKNAASSSPQPTHSGKAPAYRGGKSGTGTDKSSRQKPGRVSVIKRSKGGKSTKTGSCSSAQRGSVRGHTSGASRSGDSARSQPEGSRSASATLMRKANQSSEESASRKRAANDSDGAAAGRNSSTAESSKASGATAAASSNIDSESDDPDVSRLQALLESRGLPPRLFSNLGPRMQQVLHRSMGTNSKVQQHLQGIQSEGDESQQLQSAIELCQMLVMGNEDTLAGFPVKSAVPALTNLLKMEHNFDIMNNACRALTYMMEALPQSSSVVVDAIPILLEKLQTIQCIDVAEQSLTALDILSRRHASAVLAAGGVSSSLQYIDFFSIPAQRAALSIAANCCHAVGTIATDISGPADEFDKFMKASLPLLSSRLSHHDKKCVETACLCFVRLVDSFRQDRVVLADVAGAGLLRNFQKLIVDQSAPLSSGMLVLVVHCMTVVCSRLREHATQLLEDDITETLHYLLCGKPSDDGDSGPVQLLPRSSQETQEIASFVVQLLPRLPRDDPLFAVDCGTKGAVSKTVVWQWRDDSGQWQSCKRHESRVIEMAYARGETEIDLHTGERSVVVSFESMRLLDDNNGSHHPVQRIRTADEDDAQDSPAVELSSDTEQLPDFVRVMFPVVAELYVSSAGFPPVRHVCLQALQRMVHHSSPSALTAVLERISMSSQLSSMLSNPDPAVVVSAVQLAELLMRKLPEIFKDEFVREGVVHRIRNLSRPSAGDGGAESRPGTSGSVKSSRKASARGATSGKPLPYSLRDNRSTAKLRPRDARGGASGGKSSKVTKFASSFLSTINPTTWGKSLSSALSTKDEASTSADRRALHSKSCEKSRQRSKSAPVPVTETAENEKWLKKQAAEFLDRHYRDVAGQNGGDSDILQKLTAAADTLSKSYRDAEDSLRGISDILTATEVSPFELIQSGAIRALLRYLTTVNEASDKVEVLEDRAKVFLLVHAGLNPVPDAPITGQTVNSVTLLPALVRKLNQCFGRLEQFPVKSRELASESASVYHALVSRQLKCQLQRHPDCRVARRWLGGPIKIDPLIQMRAVERYLVMKGYGNAGGSTKQRLSASLLFLGRSQQNEDEDDDDDDDEEDEIEEMGLEDTDEFPEDDEDPLGDARDSQSARRKQSVDNATYSIEFYIANHKVPRQMTIYQALQEYGGGAAASKAQSAGSLLNNSGFWAKAHMLQYKLVKQEADKDAAEGGPASSKSDRKPQTAKKVTAKDPVWSEGAPPDPRNPLLDYLTADLPNDAGPIDDPSAEVLALLRVLHAISRHWPHLYTQNLVHTGRPLVEARVFVNSEVNAKCVRQLEDPLVVLTGQLSPWVRQVGKACPFLLSFETRQLLFKVTAFERNRALLHLQDSGVTRAFSSHLGLSGSGNSRGHSSNPFAPRIDKKKCTVSRRNLMQQAEKIMSEHAGSQAMIEVDYENEVGTGLGPTLEFFTLASKEFQNAKLKLWRDEMCGHDSSVSDGKATGPPHEIETVKTVAGLFPRPLPHSAKHNQVSRVANKFKFLGRFLGRALLDGRLVDIPLSVACYRWLLGEEDSLSGTDMDWVDPGLASTLKKLCLVAHEREKVLAETPNDIDRLEMDGCVIEDLGLDMRLPGYASVELMKGGKSTEVTARNLDQYLGLLVHWTLREGVKHQMAALKEGFESVVSLSNLKYFYPEELDLLFCGSRYRPWDVQELCESCRPDHGYTQDSETVKTLYRVLSSFDASQQRSFLQFVTGCPHLPFGGLRSLNPPLTVVRKTLEGDEKPDDYLPSVMTCLNYLKLPEYSNEAVMRAKLNVAVMEGQKSFLLS